MIEFHIPAIYIIEALVVTFVLGFRQGRYAGRMLLGFPHELTFAFFCLAFAWAFPTDATNHLTVVGIAAFGTVLITTGRGLGAHRRAAAGESVEQREALGADSVRAGIRLDPADLQKLMEGAVCSCTIGGMLIELSLSDSSHDTEDEDAPTDEIPSWVEDVLAEAEAKNSEK